MVREMVRESGRLRASSSNDQIELRDIGELPAVPDTVRERMAGESGVGTDDDSVSWESGVDLFLLS
jgi:hypothetical protein